MDLNPLSHYNPIIASLPNQNPRSATVGHKMSTLLHTVNLGIDFTSISSNNFSYEIDLLLSHWVVVKVNWRDKYTICQNVIV
jgi:hypothetical protein